MDNKNQEFLESLRDQKGSQREINKDMTIGDILTKYPEASGILFEAGIHCVGCHMAGQESLEQGLQAHGMDEKQIQEVVEKINNLIEKEKK